LLTGSQFCVQKPWLAVRLAVAQVPVEQDIGVLQGCPKCRSPGLASITPLSLAWASLDPVSAGAASALASCGTAPSLMASGETFAASMTVLASCDVAPELEQPNRIAQQGRAHHGRVKGVFVRIARS
jgi:hypothetical protein